MKDLIQVQVKNVYGTDRIYPVNDTAKKVVDLLGRKTFHKEDVKKLKAIGFVIEEVPVKI
jgi:hypothetical protein